MEQTTLLKEMHLISDMVQQMILENTHVVLDQIEYQKRYDNFTQHFKAAKQLLETILAELDRVQAQRADIESFLEIFEALDDALTEFNSENRYSLVDHATVYRLDDIRFPFKNEQKIQA